MAEIESCPFCCEREYLLIDRVNLKSFVDCINCGAEGPRKDEDDEAIEAWNSAHRRILDELNNRIRQASEAADAIDGDLRDRHMAGISALMSARDVVKNMIGDQHD